MQPTRALVLLMTVATVRASAQERTDVFTPWRVADLRQVTSARIDPQGRRAAYALAVPRVPGSGEDGASWSELHVVDLEQGKSRPFVTGEVNVSALAWTRDGSEVAYVAKRDGDDHAVLYVIPIGGGESRRAVELAGAIEAFDLAPDGKRVACVMAAAKDERREAEKKKGFAQEVYEEDARSNELWIASLESGSAEPRRVPFAGHPRDVRWSPVDDRLLVAWTPTPLVDDDYMEKRVAVVAGESGEVLARIDNPGKLGEVAWSPDGRRVSLLAAADVHDTSPARLMMAPSSGGVPSELVPGFEGDFMAVAWQDADALLAVTHVSCWSRLERIALSGAAAQGPIVRVAAGGPILTSLHLTADGKAGVFVASSPEHPAELYAWKEGEDAPHRVTDSNPGLARFALARQEVVSFQARDGLALEGVLVHPLERAGDERVPLILNVHGGPESHVSNGWLTSYSLQGQVAAARGFAVFYPNYRGSTGRGAAFAKLGQGDPAGKEFDDLVDAVDHLIALGLVDRERVGVTGGSYGGYATAWCATRFSERFAAGVMMVGISDLISKAGTTDISDEEFYVHALERPWDDWQGHLERSPIFHASASKTPLLILHGKDDPRVNPGQSRELYRHLKLRGAAPVRLVLYPGEGHGNRKAAARLDYSLRAMQWFEHYLQGPGGEPPAQELEYAEPKGEG